MSKSSPEHIVGFLLDFLPSLLPKPIDTAAKSAIDSFRGSLSGVLKEPRVQRELLEAAQKAESEFRKQAQTQLKNDELAQAVASFPLFDRDLFQSTLADLPNHLQEEYLAKDLKSFIEDDWRGRFSPEELREGVALYLNCLRVELLKVEGFAEIVVRLATLRTDQRTEQILEIVTELSQLMRSLIDRENSFNHISKQSIKPKALYQLPPKIADFTGRKMLIDELLKDFEANKGAAISGLTGMGGIGKTALGLEIANSLVEKYPDGQIFLDLKGTTSPLSSADIMRHVILSFEPMADLRVLDEVNLARVYQSVLHEKKVLLYFDNARSSEQLAHLQPSESCAMLVTSRWKFPFTGLNTHKIGTFDEDEASDFLLELCPRINDEERRALAWTCGYLPLALRIAGSFLQVNDNWQVNEYIARLADSKKRLTAFQESRKEAEMAEEYDLIATFDMSYKQLSNDEQRYFRMLSVFPASFESKGARNIWDIEEKETKRLLGVLNRYSLIEFNKSVSRYGLHELLREFAISKTQNSETKLSKQRHARYYSDICFDIARFHFSGEENHINALHVLDFEWENIVSGFLFASSKNTTPYLKAVSLYASAFDVLRLRLHPIEMIRWISLAVSAARKIDETTTLAGHLGSLGIAYLDIGNIDQSIDCHKKSLAIANKISDQFAKDALTTNAMGNMGQAYESKGDFKSAEKCYETALSISKKLKSPYSEAMDLLNIGNVKSKIGENKDAIEYILKAQDIFEKLGLLDKVGICLGTLGAVYTRLHQLELALDHLERARKIHTEIGDIHNLGACIQNIGNVYMEMEKYDIALAYFKEAMDIATLSSDAIGAAQRMVNIGSALSKSKKQKESIPYFEQAISIAKDIGAHELTFIAVQNLSIVYIELQDIEAAKEIVSSALSLFPERSIYSNRVKSLQRHLHLFNGRPLNELSELEQVLWIVGQVKSYVEVNDTRDTNEYILHMISDINAPPEFQELGRVLKKYIDGEKKLDLSNLPNEFANIVQNELGISNKEY